MCSYRQVNESVNIFIVKKEKQQVVPVKKESLPFYEQASLTGLLPVGSSSPTALIGALPTTSPSILGPFSKVLSPLSTPPTSRSLALMNLQSKLSQFKSTNASLLNSSSNSGSVSPRLVTPTSGASPCTPPLPLSLSFNPNPLPKGGKQESVTMKGMSPSIIESGVDKGHLKVTKKLPFTPNVLKNIPKGTLEAILSALSPNQIIFTTDSPHTTSPLPVQQNFISPAHLSPVAKQPLFTPLSGGPLNLSTPGVGVVTRVVLPTQHMNIPGGFPMGRAPPVIRPSLPQALNDHLYVTSSQSVIPPPHSVAMVPPSPKQVVTFPTTALSADNLQHSVNESSSEQ